MIKLVDSVKKNKVEFKPIKEGEVRIYVCGPTVYDDAHLGHARNAIVFDLWRRVFLAQGYKVVFVKNFTDIDDKIIKKMKESGKSLEALTSFYIDSYLKDMEAINVLRADIEPKATQNLNEIIKLINSLIANKSAYVSEHDVYLSVQSDANYGSLSHRVLDDDNLQARVQNQESKKYIHDFALWKASKDTQDVGYNSPFGMGRPGWHIECSAMIDAHLAYEDSLYCIDIHAGGADLLFPHHENEASQTRMARKRELAKYWLHNGFVTVNGEKMSKSLGNSYFLKDALKVYHGEILRNYLLSSHYRQNFDYNKDDLLASKARLDRIYRLKKRVGARSVCAQKDVCEIIDALQSLKAQSVQNIEKDATKKYIYGFCNYVLSALSDDINISQAFSIVESMMSAANLLLDKDSKNEGVRMQIAHNLAFIEVIFGIGSLDATEYFQLGVDEHTRAKIEEILESRMQAKKNKDYVLADALRDELRSMNIEVNDTPSGSVWEVNVK